MVKKVIYHQKATFLKKTWWTNGGNFNVGIIGSLAKNCHVMALIGTFKALRTIYLFNLFNIKYLPCDFQDSEVLNISSVGKCIKIPGDPDRSSTPMHIFPTIPGFSPPLQRPHACHLERPKRWAKRKAQNAAENFFPPWAVRLKVGEIFSKQTCPDAQWGWPIYLQNWVVLGVNVGKHAIHWASGMGKNHEKRTMP